MLPLCVRAVVLLQVLSALQVNAEANCGAPTGRPTVYIYPLNESFRERGFRNCIDDDCAYGSAETILGTTFHHSETHELCWMIYKRLKNYPCLTTDMATAELFFVPVWSHGAVPADRRGKKFGFHDPAVRASACVDEHYLLKMLSSMNPALTADGPLYGLARRHMKMDVHSNIHCEYFSRNDPKPLGWFPKTSIEIRSPKGGTPWWASFALLRSRCTFCGASVAPNSRNGT